MANFDYPRVVTTPTSDVVRQLTSASWRPVSDFRFYNSSDSFRNSINSKGGNGPGGSGEDSDGLGQSLSYIVSWNHESHGCTFPVLPPERQQQLSCNLTNRLSWACLAPNSFTQPWRIDFGRVLPRLIYYTGSDQEKEQMDNRTEIFTLPRKLLGVSTEDYQQ